MATVNTQVVVADYINYRLLQGDLEWISCPNLPEAGPVQSTMRTLGAEFEQRYNDVFQEMCNQLHITENTAQPTFTAIINELFSDGVRWGRVVALFSFAGCMAVQCMQKEMPALVSQIVVWVTNYINNQLNTWITEQGGWSAFVQFYEGDAAHRNENPWPSFKALCGYAGCAVGLLTLGAILSNRT